MKVNEKRGKQNKVIKTEAEDDEPGTEKLRNGWRPDLRNAGRKTAPEAMTV